MTAALEVYSARPRRARTDVASRLPDPAVAELAMLHCAACQRVTRTLVEQHGCRVLEWCAECADGPGAYVEHRAAGLRGRKIL